MADDLGLAVESFSSNATSSSRLIHSNSVMAAVTAGEAAAGGSSPCVSPRVCSVLYDDAAVGIL